MQCLSSDVLNFKLRENVNDKGRIRRVGCFALKSNVWLSLRDEGRLLFSRRSTPRGCPGTAFLILDQNADPGTRGRRPEEFLRPFVWEWVKFWVWVGQNPNPQGVVGGWASRPEPRSAWVEHLLTTPLVCSSFLRRQGLLIGKQPLQNVRWMTRLLSFGITK